MEGGGNGAPVDLYALAADVAEVRQRVVDANDRTRLLGDALTEHVDTTADQIAEVHRWVDDVDARVVARLDAIEAELSRHRTQVVTHLGNLWEVAELLRDRKTPPTTPSSAWLTVAVVAALAIPYCRG